MRTHICPRYAHICPYMHTYAPMCAPMGLPMHTTACIRATLVSLAPREASLLVVLARHNQKLPGRGSLGLCGVGGTLCMHIYVPCMHIRPSMCTNTCLPMCTSPFIRASLLTLAPPRGFLARCARLTQLHAAKLMERSEGGSLPSEQSDIESYNVGCGAHLEAPRPTHGGICMHIRAYMCIHRACMRTHRGMCARKLRSAACSLRLQIP